MPLTPDMFHVLIEAFLRAVLYGSTIAAAGTVFLLVTLDLKPRSDYYQALLRQAQFALPVLFAVELLRLCLLLLDHSNWSLSTFFRLETFYFFAEDASIQAVLIRLVSSFLLLVFLFRLAFLPLTILPAFCLATSYLWEGNSTLMGLDGLPWFALKLALALHLLIFHWWVAVLYPLYMLSKLKSAETFPLAYEFGRKAVYAVPLLLAAGLYLFTCFANWSLPDLSSTYQRVFLIKVVSVCLILLIAAFNKLKYTPKLIVRSDKAFYYFLLAIKLQFFLTLIVLLMTAFVSRPGFNAVGAG